MVESSSNFVLVDLREVTSKFASFINSGRSIRFWKKGSDPLHVFVESIEKNSLSIESRDEIDDSLLGARVFVNFTFNNIDYFFKGNVGKVDNLKISLELEDEGFKAEKRKNERLLSFPHHKVYSYFKVESGDADNIISINKHRGEDKAIYEEFLLEKIKKVDNSVSDIAELIGFRVLDVSSTGLSFSANSKETQYFAGVGEEGISFTLMVNGESYSVDNAQVVYIVDYVNPRAASVPMKKIGLNFEMIESLEKQINEIISGSNQVREIDKDFENFLNE